MAVAYESLALRFAPTLFYARSVSPFTNIAPEEMGGMYWRAERSGRTTCIQYITFFRQQHWVPSILDKFSGKIPGNHPNDYIPVFMYFEGETLVDVAFDICHYEAVGHMTPTSSLLPSERGPQFLVKNFYRGLAPLKSSKGHISLGGVPVPLSRERLSAWWNGMTWEGSFNEKAKFIIRKKLINPFEEITTFLDETGALGRFFDRIFQGKDNESGVVVREPDRREYTPADVQSMREFVNAHIDMDTRQFLVLPKHRPHQRI